MQWGFLILQQVVFCPIIGKFRYLFILILLTMPKNVIWVMLLENGKRRKWERLAYVIKPVSLFPPV